MKANTEGLNQSFQSRDQPTEADGRHGSVKSSESQLRSRLLEMILKSEQNRKDPLSRQPRQTTPSRG